MSAVLRAPQRVPSLFARHLDRDDSPAQPSSVPRSGVRAIASQSTWNRDIDAAVVRYVPPLVASIVLLIVARPLFVAASLAAGVSY